MSVSFPRQCLRRLQDLTEPWRAAGRIRLLSDPPCPDSQRKVLVLDEFQRNTRDLDGDGQPDAAHGEIIARCLESKGYVTSRVQLKALDPSHSFFPRDAMSRSLAAFAQAVHGGELQHRAGDVVNLSFHTGPDTVTFAEAGQLLNLPQLNAANLKDHRAEIQQRIDQLGTPLNAPEPLRVARMTQSAIRQLQKDGLTVVTSAGNDGPDRFKLGFLAADHQLSATTRSGRPLSWAASHSLTTPATGAYIHQQFLHGLDVDGDGKVDFPLPFGRGLPVQATQGSSFCVLDFLPRAYPSQRQTVT